MNNKEFWHKAARAIGIDFPGGDHSIHDDGRVWDCKNLRWVTPEELKYLVLNALSAANQRIAEQAEEIAKAQADAKWNRDLWKKSEDKADALYLENQKLRAYKEECEKAEAVGWRVPTVGGGNEFNAGLPSEETVAYWRDNYGLELEYCYTRPSPDLQKKVEELEEYGRKSDSVATDLQKENEELKRKLAEQQAALNWWNGLMSESRGISWYHLNGAVTEWGEFEIPDTGDEELQALLADARKLPEGWAEAVNLARNLSTGEWNQISTKGVLALCDAILRVDAIQVAPKPEVK